MNAKEKPQDYKLTMGERETIITFNDADSTANVYSCGQTWMNKIKKLDGWKECGAGVEVTVPKTWIKLTPTRQLSPEARKKLSDRMKKMRSTVKK